MKKSKSKSTNDVALAAKWKCDIRTIARWRKGSAPLNDNDDSMRAWLSIRKSIPSGTLALVSNERQRSIASALADSVELSKLPLGAASVLQRLESAETRAYRAFQKATETGDLLQIRAARENWLKVCEALRRFNDAVEEKERIQRDYIPRAKVEHDVEIVMVWWMLQLEGRLRDLCPKLVNINDPRKIWALMEGQPKGRPGSEDNLYNQRPGLQALREAVAAVATPAFYNTVGQPAKWFCESAVKAVDSIYLGNSGVEDLVAQAKLVMSIIQRLSLNPQFAARFTDLVNSELATATGKEWIK